MTLKSPLKGIQGWLILLAINICLLPGRLTMIAEESGRDFSKPQAQVLLSGNIIWRMIKITEVEAMIVMLPLALVMLPFFFLKHRLFPRYAILFFTALSGIYALKIILLFMLNLKHDSLIGLASTTGMSIMVMMLWISYLLRSERVKNTFEKRFGMLPVAPFIYVY